MLVAAIVSTVGTASLPFLVTTVLSILVRAEVRKSGEYGVATTVVPACTDEVLIYSSTKGVSK